MDVPDSWLFEPPISEPPAPQPTMSPSAPNAVPVDEVPPPPMTASELESAASRPMTPTPLRVRRRRNHVRHQHPYRNDGSAPLMASQQPIESLARKLSQQTLMARRDQDHDSSERMPTTLMAASLTEDSMQGHEPARYDDSAMEIDPVEADDLEPLRLPLPRSVEMMRRRRMLSRRQVPSSARRGPDVTAKMPEPVEALPLLSRSISDLAMKSIEPDSLPPVGTTKDETIDALDPIETLLPPRRAARSTIPATEELYYRTEGVRHPHPYSTTNATEPLEPIEPTLPSRKPTRSLEALVMRPLPGTWRDHPPIEALSKDSATVPEPEADEGFCDGADELSWLNDCGSSLAGPSRLIQSNGVLRFKRSSEAAMQCSVVVQKTARMRRRRQRKQEVRSRASSLIPTSFMDCPDVPVPYLNQGGPALAVDKESAEPRLDYDGIR
ncbi:hypothetical protein JDV02_006645 [Purpureocillium takamizusanense]|uniref:Uncharacterized protein n=1 Tax=Purpureocillium takamizusanense TaxID=2060973 RepID=A0A9Q8VBI9_9HYPO|nr:uncharacterized protein JDV02_006645 [Purpureocillium takamizusanense]UNI20570.1 hypothetical protein JDV02_006645 [Purpureocillium takamizusanense]